MTLTDVILGFSLFGFSLYILYRSMWKKKNPCSLCSGECVNKKER